MFWSVGLRQQRILYFEQPSPCADSWFCCVFKALGWAKFTLRLQVPWLSSQVFKNLLTRHLWRLLHTTLHFYSQHLQMVWGFLLVQSVEIWEMPAHAPHEMPCVPSRLEGNPSIVSIYPFRPRHDAKHRKSMRAATADRSASVFFPQSLVQTRRLGLCYGSWLWIFKQRKRIYFPLFFFVLLLQQFSFHSAHALLLFICYDVLEHVAI